MQYVNPENPEKLYFYNGITMTNDVRLTDGIFDWTSPIALEHILI